MSPSPETPRTDEAEIGYTVDYDYDPLHCALRELSRTLERELATLRAQETRLRDALQNLVASAEAPHTIANGFANALTDARAVLLQPNP